MQFPLSKNFRKTISSAEELKDHPLERAGIERMLSIIGEAAKNVSPQLLERRPGYSLESNGRHA
ncbi:HepT-like ribonuclease domain-containing protein [Methanoregula sp.]|uniref:HepT-like ribonuclease domain-containing protein n=1 Tax=Methanoregula sp. TaxID=2052170 RepID=UPI003564A862